MTNSLKINLNLEEVKTIVLDYCKKKFNDDKLELKFNTENIKYYKGNSDYIMEVFSKNVKQDFCVERSVKISNDDIENIFSPILEDLGYEIADYNWIFEENDDIKLLFTVAELEKTKQKSIGGK